MQFKAMNAMQFKAMNALQSNSVQYKAMNTMQFKAMNAMQFKAMNALQSNSVQYKAMNTMQWMQCNSIQCNECNAIQFNAIQSKTIQNNKDMNNDCCLRSGSFRIEADTAFGSLCSPISRPRGLSACGTRRARVGAIGDWATRGREPAKCCFRSIESDRKRCKNPIHPPESSESRAAAAPIRPPSRLRELGETASPASPSWYADRGWKSCNPRRSQGERFLRHHPLAAARNRGRPRGRGGCRRQTSSA